MQKSLGWLDSWSVLNKASESDTQEDGRQIVLEFAVPQKSNVSMAVAALSGDSVRLTVCLAGVDEGGLQGVSAYVGPPWSAKKRGGFHFKAVLDYAENYVRELVGVTYGQAVNIGIDVVQEEMDMDEDRQAALAFVKADHDAG